MTITIEQNQPSVVSPRAWEKQTKFCDLIVDEVQGQFLPFIQAPQGQLIWSGKMFLGVDAAQAALVESYYQNVGKLEPGLQDCDVDLLYPHPKNGDIYVNDEFEDLIKLIDVDEPYIAPLEITPTGRVVAGNRRLKSVRIINSRREALGQPRIEYVPVVVKDYSSERQELEQLIKNNATRRKTPAVLAWEAFFLAQIEGEKAKERQSQARTGQQGLGELKEDAGRTRQKVGELLGLGQGKADNLIQAGAMLASAQEAGDTELQAKLTKALTLLTANGAKQLTKVTDRDKKLEVCDRLIAAHDANLSKPPTIKEILADIDAREKANVLALAHGADKSEKSGRLEILKTLQENPNDTWETPDDVIKDVERVLGQIEIDLFADLNHRVPALQHYTIRDDSFKQTWSGKVFANFPFSKQKHCFQKLDEQICSGATKEGVFVVEGGAIHAQGSQNVIKKHKMVYCVVQGRMNFIVSELLAAEMPDKYGAMEGQKTSNAQNDTIIVYYGENFEKFDQVFSKYGDIRYTRAHIATAASGALTMPKFDEQGYCSFLGWELQVKRDEMELYNVYVGTKCVSSDHATEKEAQAAAIAHILLSGGQKPLFLNK